MLGFSANPGTETEVVLATAGYPASGGGQGHVYVAVKWTPGTLLAVAPYTLQIETSRPLATCSVRTSRAACSRGGPEHSDRPWCPPPRVTPLTLFVTQLERLSSLYPAGATPGDPRDGGRS